jgi:hypothetical protein
MIWEPTEFRDPAARALRRAIAGAEDPQIVRIVALVDQMMQRGPADLLIAPLRQRLARLRPPRPLRFDRLMFHPLDLLIGSVTRWRPGQQAIPRSALMPMAEHVRLAMGPAAVVIGTEIAGRTTDDCDLISRLGRSLWPEAARILAEAPMPESWDATELGIAAYLPLASIVAALLAEASAVDRLHADAATGLLPPPPATIEAMLVRVARRDAVALPMMLAVLLDQVPDAAALLPAAQLGPEATAIQAALDGAADLLLRQLGQEDSTESRIATGTLADAGVAVSRMAALLRHLDVPDATPRRRDRLRAVRQRLEADCKARFASGLEDEVLAPLLHLGVPPAPADIPALESAARGLRVLETEARIVGSGSTYDVLLGKAAEAIKDRAMRDRLSRADQLRLVEILVGSDAALAMLDAPS